MTSRGWGKPGTGTFRRIRRPGERLTSARSPRPATHLAATPGEVGQHRLARRAEGPAGAEGGHGDGHVTAQLSERRGTLSSYLGHSSTTNNGDLITVITQVMKP